MPDPVSPFLSTRLPIGNRTLEAHANPVTCVLAGRRGPLKLQQGGLRAEGDLLLVRPGVVHEVALTDQGADVLYLNGLHFPSDAPLAVALRGPFALSAELALRGEPSAVAEVRARLTLRAHKLSARMADVVRAILAEPMRRMSQGELSRRLGLERTQALRCFKEATGQTFRAFKSWSALQHAAALMVCGELVRTAAMDAGFADTAHLSRVFRWHFGLTPSAAIAGLQLNGRHPPANSAAA